jgi:all-trans-retinol 13,14-reductase
MKRQMEQKLLRIVEEQYPKTKGHIVHVSSGTPLTNNFYLGTVNGEVWDLDLSSV